MRFVRIGILVALEAAAQPQPATAPLRASDVVPHVKQTISWYGHVNALEQTPALASDVLLRDSIHSSALRTLQLAFDFGRAAATLVETSGATEVPASTAAPQSQSLTQAAARAAARVTGLQDRIKELDASLDKARGAARETLRAQRSTLQAQLNLANQVRDTVNSLASFTPTGGSGTLSAQIEELERSAPEAAHSTRPGATAKVASAPAPATAAPPPLAAFRPETTGIIGLGTELFTLSHNRSQLRNLIDDTDELKNSLEGLRRPLVNEVRNIVRRSEALGQSAGTDDIQQLAANQRDLDSLTARFKQLSAVLVPLGEQNIMLGAVRGDLNQAVDGLSALYSDTARYLLLRLGVLALAIGGVLVVSTLWRRVTFRYVHDERRRNQFLTLRRVVMAVAIVLVVMLSFITEFGSLATYAGLLTAGIAVALQNVILAVVGYFFLIGRYGVRTGDRITISGVTGNVIDIGLVRIYMAELAGTGGDLHSTGRIVVFSNAVLFQNSALFKQLPGMDHVWHRVRLVFVPETEFQLAENRLTEVVDGVFQHHREAADKLHDGTDHAFGARMARPEPEVRLRMMEEGLEATIQYPAPLKRGSVTDDRLIQAIRETVAREPQLKLTESGAPALVANPAA